jgi:hypothetical protein
MIFLSGGPQSNLRPFCFLNPELEAARGIRAAQCAVVFREES